MRNPEIVPPQVIFWVEVDPKTYNPTGQVCWHTHAAATPKEGFWLKMVETGFHNQGKEKGIRVALFLEGVFEELYTFTTLSKFYSYRDGFVSGAAYYAGYATQFFIETKDDWMDDGDMPVTDENILKQIPQA